MQDFELEEFLREACEDGSVDASSARQLSQALSSLIGAKPALGRQRLLAALEPLPLRYAPFFTRIGELWDLPASEVETWLERARDAVNWRKPGLPGLRLVDVVGGASVRDAHVSLVRFAAGMYFPAHYHPGPEALLVLEGSYRDASGLRVGPGDVHRMPPGSEHWFRVGREGPCVAASVQFGREFTGYWMKILTRWFG